MNEITHDPFEYVKGLQQLFVSDKKRIGFLFGAGTSLAKKNDNSPIVPGIKAMTNDICKSLVQKNKEYKSTIDEIKEELGDDFNIELFLSNIEQKHQIIGKGNLNGLDKDNFKLLIEQVKSLIRETVSIHKNINHKSYNDLIQSDFAEWIKQAERKYGIEIFTTNFDYLFEIGFEYKNVPYYDGFTGSFNAFFNSDSIEDFSFLSLQTKLWKIHGSLGWHFDEDIQKVIRTHPDDDDILVYPSILKYMESKKLPYVSLMDRLSNFLRLSDSVLITCGYSFGDQHINERFISALNANTNAHIIVLNHGDIDKNANLKSLLMGNNNISGYGFRDAIIGCKYGKWRLRAEPDKDETPNINIFYDEDAPFNNDEILNTEKKGNQDWTGEGKFILPNFDKLVNFLKSPIPSDY